MLSDEERKAIANLKIEYEKLIKEDNILFPLYKSDAKRLIEIIEKQSKEIEELKEDIDKFKKALGKRITYCNELEKDLFENCSNYVVSKDKIKAIIEEYEKALNILLQKDDWIEPSDTIIRNKFIHYIEFGQSLLEKE